MRLLLDTQPVVWWLEEDERLSSRAGEAISQAGQEAVVSAARALIEDRVLVSSDALLPQYRVPVLW